VYGVIAKDLRRVSTAFLNRHAFLSFQEQKKKLPLDIDRPTPFTQNALAFYKASVGRLESGVFAKPIQAEYLKRLLGPTTRYAQAKFVFVPASSQQTDAYGNMPKTRRRQALRGKIHTVRKGRARLVFRHQGKQREFLGVFIPSTRYKVKQWRFYDISINI